MDQMVVEEMEPFQFPPTADIDKHEPILPKDEEGFTQSFLPVGQEKELLEFWNKYGIVVIRDVISNQQVEKTVDEIWSTPRLLGRTSLDRSDPLSWKDGNWPTELGIASVGFISHFADCELPLSWENRQNPELCNIFTQILGRKDIWVNFDRYGVMRPTTGITLKDGSTIDKPEWKTKGNWLHWDLNPWRDCAATDRVQGLLALSDSKGPTGGFHCVPGFHKKIIQWTSDNQAHKKHGGLINVPEQDSIRQQIEQVSLRKGSFLIWDSRICHGNYPNESNGFRVVQYITYHAAKDAKEAEKRMDIYNLVCTTEKTHPKLTELGEQIL